MLWENLNLCNYSVVKLYEVAKTFVKVDLLMEVTAEKVLEVCWI